MWSDHDVVMPLMCADPGKVRRVRATEIVLRHIEQQLESGDLQVGMRLPGERGLAEQLSVSRGSVREALQVLAAMGAVRRSVGSGQDAGAILIAEPAAALDAALRLHVTTRAFPVAHVVETRVLLESWAVSRAAASDSATTSLDDVHRLLELMDAPDIEIHEFLRLDAEFHVTIAGLSGNTVVAQMMTSLRGSIETYVLAAIPQIDDWPAVMDKLRREHHAVADAIARGAPEQAAAAVTRHIHEFYERSGLS